MIPKNVDLESTRNLVVRIAKASLASYYQNVKDYSAEHLQKKSKLLAKLIDLDVHVTFKLPECDCQTEQVTLHYYCYPKDHVTISEHLKLQISKQLNELSELKLAKHEQDKGTLPPV